MNHGLVMVTHTYTHTCTHTRTLSHTHTHTHTSILTVRKEITAIITPITPKLYDLRCHGRPQVANALSLHTHTHTQVNTNTVGCPWKPGVLIVEDCGTLLSAGARRGQTRQQAFQRGFWPTPVFSVCSDGSRNVTPLCLLLHCVRVSTCPHTHTHTHMHTCTHARANTHTRTHTHTYMYTHTHTHTSMHKHTEQQKKRNISCAKCYFGTCDLHLHEEKSKCRVLFFHLCVALLLTVERVRLEYIPLKPVGISTVRGMVRA